MIRDDQIAETIHRRHIAFIRAILNNDWHTFRIANQEYLALKRPTPAGAPAALPRKRRQVQTSQENQLKLL